MRWLVIALILLGSLILDAAASATAVSSDALDADVNNAARSPMEPAGSATPAEPVTVVRSVPVRAVPTRTPSANPLWGIPLGQLSETRDRPIFSPSRRPPPVAAAIAAPVKPPPPKREIRPPQLSLVGTIASEDESFGIFLDQSTKAALRLKVGEDYQGWKLQMIRGREVTMEKDEHAAIMTLPGPGEKASGSIRLIPVREIKTPVATQQ
jgi:general secretion pathway protein N